MSSASVLTSLQVAYQLITGHNWPLTGYDHLSKSYVTTNIQSASLPWCQAPSGEDHVFVTVRQLGGLLTWGALSHERTGLPFIIQSQSHFMTGGLPLISSSWRKAP
jgi:hypothetical protein